MSDRTGGERLVEDVKQIADQHTQRFKFGVTAALFGWAWFCFLGLIAVWIVWG